MASCCQVVGDLQLGINGCVISINTNCSTESTIACGDETPLAGPTTGTITITAIADDEPWVGCPAKAGVNIPYIRKYDCDNDIIYFISNGQGQSFVSGDTKGLASVKYPLDTCLSLSASSSSGPASLYTESEQVNGYGFIFSGDPIRVETDKNMEPINIGFGPSKLYLQSVSFDAQPTQLPTVTYTFVHGGNR
jgi:hypothetical protein